ncbi:MAG: nucleotidyltransferase family protein [Sulfobacillus sp.]
METQHRDIRIPIPDAALTRVCQRYKVRELSLFGSVLRDDFTENSDVDVLVEFEPDAPVLGFGFFELMHALEDEVFHRKVDLVQVGALSHYIADEVMAERMVVCVAPPR